MTEPKRDRLGFNLTPDGQPDFESMHSATRAKLAAVLANPETARRLGIQPQAPVSPESRETVEALGAQVALLVSMGEMIVLKRMAVPDDIIREVAPLDETQAKLIVGVSTRLLEKYAAGPLSKYGDEAAALLALANITVTKITQARTLMAERGPKPKPSEVRPEAGRVLPMTGETVQ